MIIPSHIFPAVRSRIQLPALIVALMLVEAPLQAAPSGLPDGRSAQVGTLSGFSGEFAYRHIEAGSLAGLRLNFRVGTDALLFVDAAKTSDSVDGLAAASEVDVIGRAYGVGLYHNLPRLSDAMYLGVRAALHQINSDVDENLVVGNIRADAEVARVTFDLAIRLSPSKPLFDNGLQGYVALGMTRHEDKQQVDVDGVRDARLDRDSTDTNATIAAGVVLPIRVGQLYAAVEHDEVVAVSLGFRLFLSSQKNSGSLAGM